MSTSTESNPASLNVAFVEDMYESYLRDHSSVSEDWVHYFESMNGDATAGIPPKLNPSFKSTSIYNIQCRVSQYETNPQHATICHMEYRMLMHFQTYKGNDI
ncbi:MAG TPA: hypothetical protein EYN96_02320, partial [Candidatus Hydrogenedentes bacterium]|nr:hypothetical protein [Candidatus Hydrogenedentota bacterium]